MIARSLIAMALLVTGLLLGRYIWQPPETPLEAVAGVSAATPYVCPMHPDVVDDKPGTCPICGMALVQARNSAGEDMEDGGGHGHAHAAAPYVCPMHPDVMSGQPGTCPVCGMALVQAKQENAESVQDMETAAQQRPAVRIAPEVINNLGVKTALVKRTTLMRRIDTPGFVQQIQPGQTRRVLAPFDAKIAAVRFAPGEWVEAGKPLLVLESAALLRAEQAHLALLAQSEAPPVSPAQTDAGDKPTTQIPTLEESRRALTQLGLSSQDIRTLEDTREPGAQLTLSAPFVARVDNVHVEPGASVQTGAPLFELTGMARASVLANAFQRDAAWIQTGQPVEVRLPHVSGEVWAGVVNQGAVSIDPDSQNIGVRLSFSAPTHLLKSAMYVVATIMGDARKDVLAVPQDALIRTEAEDRVIVARGEGRFEPVPVRVGIETGGQVEIMSGLEEGDQVVVSAQFLIDSESSLQASFLRMTGGMSEPVSGHEAE